MKKIFILALVLILCAMIFCACTNGNRQIGITYTFRWAVIQLGNGELIEGEVSSWRDFSEVDEVQVTINGITYLTHYSNVILATNKF